MQVMHRLDLGFFNSCVVCLSDGTCPDFPEFMEQIFYYTNSRGNICCETDKNKIIHIPVFEITASRKGNLDDKAVQDDMLAEIGMKIVCMISHMTEQHDLLMSLDNITVLVKKIALGYSEEDDVSYGWADVGIAYFVPKEKVQQ